ncbi:MAG: phosphate ABC transporter permease subunit PstC [Clostridia bacterium]|nr:phosphate ABC transporter permease subunit PstC [Clostridia bacterium]
MYKLLDRLLARVIKLLTLFSLLLLAFAIIFIFRESLVFFQEVSIFKFITGTTWNPLYSPDTLSIFNIILGTLYVSLIAIVIALPIGIGCGLLLAGYTGGRPSRLIRGIIDILASIPSVVYGFIGLLVLVKFLENNLAMAAGESVLAGGILLAVMVLPYIISTCNESMTKAYQTHSPYSHALGVSKNYLLRKIVFPESKRAILAATVLALGRAMGETMAVMMVIGNAPIAPKLLGKCQTIPSLIALEMGMAQVGSLHYHGLYAAGFVLMMVLLIINLILYFVRKTIVT